MAYVITICSLCVNLACSTEIQNYLLSFLLSVVWFRKIHSGMSYTLFGCTCFNVCVHISTYHSCFPLCGLGRSIVE
ncbi:hypothetical protein HanIR_Chr04g0204961 [Helianthus annuus]|nr:hypothetical protein HanIR_Chr04g0204961 [Helianthus annuus]